MKKNKYKVIGVMSGTSLDGIDLVCAEFMLEEKWEFSIINAETISYSPEWRKKLNRAVNFSEDELLKLNQEYTVLLADVILEFLQKNKIKNPDAVCSHGHTIKHEPQNNYTLQIGNLPNLAKRLQLKTVCDFRVQDVKLGGQGAPLVPLGDELLFSEYGYCLNLGGFANISTSKNRQRIAYDICAVNTVLNYYAEKLGVQYDSEGKIAENGSFNEELFSQLEALEFYKKPAPKSLGIEWVNQSVFPILNKFGSSVPEILHTYVHHIISQLSKNIENSSKNSVLVTGGGAFNNYLINLLKSKTSAKIVLPSAAIINYKEALIFAFLGILRMRGEINVLASVTGAEKDHSSGEIYEP